MKIRARVTDIGFARIVLLGILATAPNVLGNEAELSRDALIRIVHSESFRAIRRCDAVPREDLVRANLISNEKGVKSFIVDRNQPYQSGDGLVDLEKAQRQLILGAISREYLLLCFYMGGQGGPGRYLMVIHRSNAKSQVVCYASLGTFGTLRNLSDLGRLIESDGFSMGKWSDRRGKAKG